MNVHELHLWFWSEFAVSETGNFSWIEEIAAKFHDEWIIFVLSEAFIFERGWYNDYEKNKTTIEAKIYELIFSKGQMTKEEVFSYLNISIDDFDKYLNDMIEKNVFELNKDNKYEIKKNK